MADLLTQMLCPPAPRPYAHDGALWYEDLHVGDCFISRDYEVTQQEIIAFACRFDPQLFHLDPEAAKNTFFGGLAASGWHTASITMRLVAESLPLAWGVIGAGTDRLHWPRATRAGDCLRVKSVIESMRPLKSKPGLGMVVVRCSTVDQHEDLVQVVVPKLMVPFRAPGSTASPHPA